MRCAGKWVGLVQRWRSLNEDTAHEQLYVDAYMFLWCFDPFKKRLKESFMFRSWEMKRIQCTLPACPLFLANLQSWNLLKGSPLPLQTFSECPQWLPWRIHCKHSSVSGIQLRRKMLWRMESESHESEKINSMCLAGKLWTTGWLDAAKKRHAHGCFLRKQHQKKRRSFLSLSALGQIMQ